jgi:sarcosine oxidase subunit beta
VALSLLARAKLRAFADEVGGDAGYLPAGYLWLAASDEELAVLRQGIEVQRAAGLTEAVEVDAADALRLNPALAPDGIAGGAWCPTDGFIKPLGILAGYLAAARRLGARVEWDVEVTGFTRDANGAISEVRTGRGRVPTATVVNAAGAWAAPVAALAGVSLPVVPLRRQLVPTVPCELLPVTMPMTLYARDGFHFRVRDGRVLFGYPTPGAAGLPWDTRVEPGWTDEVGAMMRARIPRLAEVALDERAAWGGLYEVSPDKHAILGTAPECPNLFLVNGSSGHGVMHSPALGHLLAEMMSGDRPGIDVAPLAFSRFAEGRLNPVSELL